MGSLLEISAIESNREWTISPIFLWISRSIESKSTGIGSFFLFKGIKTGFCSTMF
jgi:hypothetical protein